jgi:3-methylcrotonyl-CoA carboxylase alpha subunit
MRDALARYRTSASPAASSSAPRATYLWRGPDTALIEREHDVLFPAAASPADDVWLLAALAEVERDGAAARIAAASGADAGSPWRALDGWRLNGSALRRLGFRSGETMREVDVAALPGGAWQLVLDGKATVARAAAFAPLEGEAADPFAVVAVVEVRVAESVDAVGEQPGAGDGKDAEHDEEGAGLLAPMPGKVIALLAKPGTAVDKGAPLLVLEAMKMEHTISAARRHREGVPLRGRRPGGRARSSSISGNETA